MIKLLGQVPRQVVVAVSGGIDSMAALDFLSSNHTVTAAFFHHGTENSCAAYKFLVDYCSTRSIPLLVGRIRDSKPAGKSPEEHWRVERYRYLDSLEMPIVTGHTLDDVAETWLWSCMHGTPSLIPYRRNTVIRPFLLTRKGDLEAWAERKGVPHVHDSSNDDIRYTRNYIRHNVINHAMHINPGLHTLLKKKMVKRGVD